MTSADTEVEVAWLDTRGVITAVNGAWDSFRQANQGHPDVGGVGTSYVEACRQAADPTAQASHCTVHNTLTHTPDVSITLTP